MSAEYPHFSSPGVALVLSGPSGAGKTTVRQKLTQLAPALEFSISCTTRKVRAGEKDGRDYHFLKSEEFLHRLENEEFLEHAEVHGNYYGTLKTEIYDRVKNGRDVLVDIDVQGMRQLRKACEKDKVLRRACVFVFIAPPSFSELEKRLRKRATDSEETIAKRLLNARDEIAAWQEYDYLVLNDDADRAAERLNAIRQASAIRSSQLHPLDGWPHLKN